MNPLGENSYDECLCSLRFKVHLTTAAPNKQAKLTSDWKSTVNEQKRKPCLKEFFFFSLTHCPEIRVPRRKKRRSLHALLSTRLRGVSRINTIVVCLYYVGQSGSPESLLARRKWKTLPPALLASTQVAGRVEWITQWWCPVGDPGTESQHASPQALLPSLTGTHNLPLQGVEGRCTHRPGVHCGLNQPTVASKADKM